MPRKRKRKTVAKCGGIGGRPGPCPKFKAEKLSTITSDTAESDSWHHSFVTDTRPSLVDGNVVGGLLTDFVVSALRSMEDDDGTNTVGLSQITDHAQDLAEAFLGGDPHYQTLRSWNHPSAIVPFLEKRIPLHDDDSPQDKLAAVLIVMLKDVLQQMTLAEKHLDEQWLPEVGSIIQNYTMLLMGIDPVDYDMASEAYMAHRAEKRARAEAWRERVVTKSLFALDVRGERLKAFDESKHPRGKPGNAGQFTESSGGSSDTAAHASSLTTILDNEAKAMTNEARSSWKFSTASALVRDLGQDFQPSAKPTGVEWGEQSHCYNNAYDLMASKPGKYVYTEGYVLPKDADVPIMHAWVVDRKTGAVVDNTLRTPGREYRGISFRPWFVKQQRESNGAAGILPNMWRQDFTLLQAGFPENAVADGAIAKSWDASKHPRGQPDNAGQFAESGSVESPVRTARDGMPTAGNAISGQVESRMSLDGIEQAKKFRSKPDALIQVATTPQGHYRMNNEGRAALKRSIANAVGKSVKVSDQEARSLVSEIGYVEDYQGMAPGEMVAAAMIDGWGASAKSAGFMLMQQAAAEKFGVPASNASEKVTSLYQKHKAVLDGVVSAIYDRTQQYLADNDITQLTVYRGMPGGSGVRPWMRDAIANDNLDVKPGEMQMKPLSSFSTSLDMATSFAATGSDYSTHGFVYGTTVPAKDVFSLANTGPGCFNENEIVLVGNSLGGKMRSFPHQLLDDFDSDVDDLSTYSVKQPHLTEELFWGNEKTPAPQEAPYHQSPLIPDQHALASMPPPEPDAETKRLLAVKKQMIDEHEKQLSQATAGAREKLQRMQAMNRVPVNNRDAQFAKEWHELHEWHDAHEAMLKQDYAEWAPKITAINNAISDALNKVQAV